MFSEPADDLPVIQGSALGGVFPEPVPWFDNIARHLVIWVGVLGGWTLVRLSNGQDRAVKP